MKNFILIFLALITNSAFAQNISAAKEKQFAKRPLTFIENKGQVTDQYGNARHDIQYKTGSAGMGIFIGCGQLHYQWSKKESKIKEFPFIAGKQHLLYRGREADTIPTCYTMYRLDMTLEGANPDAQVISGDKQTFYENYHTTALHSGNTTACTYNKITYKNIYPHIDWTLYIKDNKLEYDFIVRPGGDVTDIKIKYNGATDIAHTDGNIEITTPLGGLNEQNLYAYEKSSRKKIEAKFVVEHNNLIAFAANKYSGTLVIDPTLAWGTYFGGDGEDEAMGTACDFSGNTYITGRTSSISNIATIGSYQIVFGGYEDAFLAKFNNSSGNILWATYYGGSSQDNGYAVACDNKGNSYITGFTLSANNIATMGSHQTTYMGGWDAYLAKFDSSGNIQWGTYYGGSFTDWGWDVAPDTTGDIYICGVTNSANNIATPGSYQDTIGGLDSTNNAFLAKFSTNGTLLWGTYFGGGSYGNAAFACACDKAQSIYIAGTVEGSNIYTTPGCYQDIFGGGEYDCFIAKFDSTSNLKWSTYYGGNGGEFAQGIACDDSLNAYITGITYSTDGIATPGAHQAIYGGGSNDIFLAKFNDTGSRVWATYYGGIDDDEGTGVVCDNVGNIFVTGYTNSPNGITTPGSFDDAYMGGLDDAFLSKFNNSGLLLWGTYYGGSSGDGAYGVACDNTGNVYMTGGTASSSGIATNGTYQNSFDDSTDAFLVKFDTGATTLVAQINQQVNVQLFPSPNNGNFKITGKFLNNYNTATIEIVNLSGQLIYHADAVIQDGQLNQQISLPGIATGDYLMKLNAGNETKKIKFLIE